MALLIRARAAACAAVVVLAGACDFVRPPTWVGGDPDQLLVHAMLVAGSDSAAVLVTRASGEQGRPVSGAQVRLMGDGWQAVLVETVAERVPCSSYITAPNARTGCYVAALPAPVRIGAEYRLEVDGPGGERVRGSTVVPQPATMLAPEDRQRLSADSMIGFVRSAEPVRVRWSAQGPASLVGWAGRAWSPDAREARCSTNLHRTHDLTHPDLPADSARVTVEVSNCYQDVTGTPVARLDSVEVVLGVTTYDETYLAYIRDAENGVPLEQARGGLEGAFGVFGSATTARRRVILIPR